jgi:hypothetical protein
VEKHKESSPGCKAKTDLEAFTQKDAASARATGRESQTIAPLDPNQRYLKFSVECSIPRIGKAMTRTKTAEQSSKFKIRNSKQIQMSKTTKFQNELAGASDAGGKGVE